MAGSGTIACMWGKSVLSFHKACKHEGLLCRATGGVRAESAEQVNKPNTHYFWAYFLPHASDQRSKQGQEKDGVGDLQWGEVE